MAEVNLTLGDPIEVKVSPAEGATNVSVASAPQNVVQVQAAIATNGLQGADGVGVPAGGEEGLFLVKLSGSDHDTGWGYVHTITEVVKNETGGTLNKGTAVHIDGEDASGNPIVVKADNDDPNRMPCHFVLNETIEDGQTGEGIVSGMISGVNTNFGGFQSGDTVYVGAEGGYVKTKPSGSDKKVQNIAVISHVHGSQGTAYIMGAGRSNDIPNLDSGHFFLGGATNTTSPYELPISSPTNGQLLKANADGNLVFVNASDVTKNIGTADLTTTNTTRNLDIIEDGHLNIRDAQNDPILYIDEATKRVGINTTVLDKDAALFVNGNVLFKDDSTIGVEGGQEFNIGKIGAASGVATVNVTGDLNVTGNCTIDTNLKFGSAGNQLLAYPGTFAFGRNGSSATSYQFNGDVTNVSFENTGDVNLKNASGLKIFNGSTNNIAIQAPTLSGSYTLTLPTTSGTDGYVLKTDGSGTTSWVDVTAVSDALLDSDFSDADSGLMKKASAGTYEIATADTDYQSVPSEGAFADGDKTKLDYITVGAAINLGQAVLTGDTDISGASFVVDEDDMTSDLDTKVPTQQSVKAYVDSHVKTAIYSDASDNPQLAAGVTAGEVRTLIGAIDDYTVTQGDVTAHQAALSIATTQLTGLSATGNVSGITLSQTDGAFTLGGSLGTIPISGGGTGATNAAGARSALNVDAAGTDNSTNVSLASVTDNYLQIAGQEITAGTVPLSLGGTGATSDAGARAALSLQDSDIINKFSGGTGITLAADGTISSDITQTSTTDDLNDVSAAATNDGEILIYNSGTGDYDPATITGGDNVTVTNSAGGIEISADGGGLTYTPLATLSGRFQWNSTDDNRTILCGNTSYGTNYYLWSTKVFNTVSNGTPDVTTQSISTSYSGVSFRILESKKIRWEYNHRPINSNGVGRRYKAQIWSSATMPSSGSTSSWTLRGESDVTAGSASTRWVSGFALTKSAIPAGHYVMFVFGLTDNITATTYLVLQSQTYLQD